MRRMLPRYFLLTFLSFTFFSAVFHAIAADAQVTTDQPELQSPVALQTTPIVPTPTIYIELSSPPIQKQTVHENITLPSPTPTIYIDIAPPQTTETTPSPTPEQNIQQTYDTTEVPAVSPTATPTPTAIPTPQPTAVQTGPVDLDTLFNQYSTQYNVSAAELEKIAQCESGFNTNSDNSGIYLGMFQFAASSWSSVRTEMGLDPNPDLRTNAEEAIKTAAFMLSRGEEDAWPNCH